MRIDPTRTWHKMEERLLTEKDPSNRKLAPEEIGTARC